LPSEPRFLEENLEPGAIELLACATTLPDLLVSGFVSTVQGELSELSPLEIVSTQGGGWAGVSALNYAPSQLEPCQKQTAIAVAAEFSSPLFKNTQFEASTSV
jgi:3-oxoacyl-[acyl-carrier-protein] synthase-3